MSSTFFSEFAPAGKAVWEKQAQKELKEKFPSHSQREICNGIYIDAYLTANEVDPKQAEAMQSCQKNVPGWQNLPRINFKDPAQTNTEIKNALRSGGDGVWIILGEKILSAHEFSRLFLDVRLSDHTFFFQTRQPAQELFQRIAGHTGYRLSGGVALDPIAQWMRTGLPYEEAIENTLSVNAGSGFFPIMVESHIYHNNGADPAQELAFTLSSAVTYLDLLTEAGLSPDQAFQKLFFSVSIGTSYLTEIGKLRALRHLLDKVTRAYGIAAGSGKPFIHTQPSYFYHAEEAEYTNMIRESSEAMSAVVGGCDAWSPAGFQSHLPQPGALSERIASNVSPVLSYEGMLDAVADPAAGSYAIETISVKLSEAAWALFLTIEKEGGLIAGFKSGFVQKELKKSLQSKINALNSEKVMVGVNRFTEETTYHAQAVNISPNPENEAHLLADLRLGSCFKNQLKTQ